MVDVFMGCVKEACGQTWDLESWKYDEDSNETNMTKTHGASSFSRFVSLPRPKSNPQTIKNIK